MMPAAFVAKKINPQSMIDLSKSFQVWLYPSVGIQTAIALCFFNAILSKSKKISTSGGQWNLSPNKSATRQQMLMQHFAVLNNSNQQQLLTPQLQQQITRILSSADKA